MFCPSPTCALCQESSEGWTGGPLAVSQVAAEGRRHPVKEAVTPRIWGAGLPICLFTPPSLSPLQSPRRPPPLASLPPVWALARGLCLRGRHVPGGQDRSLAACAARTAHACTHAPSRSPVGSGQVSLSQWACCLSCTDGWTDSLASRQRRDVPIPVRFRGRGQCGAGSERCGEPGVSVPTAQRAAVNGDAMVGEQGSWGPGRSRAAAGDGIPWATIWIFELLPRPLPAENSSVWAGAQAAAMSFWLPRTGSCR